MRFSVDPLGLTAFLVALARTSAFVVIAPPFNSAGVPLRVRIGLSVGLALAVQGQIPADAALQAASRDTAALVGVVAVQATVGLLLGFLVLVVFAALQAAGQILDAFAGFTMAASYDPLSNASSSPIGRLYQLLGVVLLFVLNGHLVIVRSFLGSFRTVPPEGPSLAFGVQIVTRGMATLTVSAVQIAVPLAAALFLADVAIAIIGRAAPRVNLLVLGLGAKSLLAIALLGMMLPVLPGVTRALVERSAELMHAVGR